MKLIARNAFGDLFLLDQSGEIWRLDVSVAMLQKIADCETKFRSMLQNAATREEWFADDEVKSIAERGLVPSENQCIGFYPPLVFADQPHAPYLIDIYENVAFLGDLNEQLADVPDGGKVKLSVGEKPTSH
jgi:hypothetical protein